MKRFFALLLTLGFTFLLIAGTFFSVVIYLNTTRMGIAMDVYVILTFFVSLTIIAITIEKWVKKILEVEN